MNFRNNEDSDKLTERFARATRDFDDLQNEIAGREVGRIERFLPGGAHSAASSGKAKQERAEALSRLQLLLSDPAYAALYRETTTALADAQNKLEQMLERVQLEMQRTEAALEEMRDRAARLEVGTRVYRDRDGNVRTEDGKIIEDALAVGIIWNGTEPSFEDMQAELARKERLEALESDILAGQAEIGDMQAALQDDEDPPTESEMEGFKDRAEEIVGNAEKRIEAELETMDAAPEISEHSSEPAAKITVSEI